MKFEWDPVKAHANEGKHGVTFDEASTVFGLSSLGRVLVVSHTDRGGIVRITSARPVTRKEKRIYEES